MASDFELRKQIRRVIGLDIYRATLGDADGRVDAIGLPGYVNIRYIQAGGAFSQPVTVRFRAVMKKTPGTAVIVGFDDDGELAVLRPDFVGETSVGTYPQGDNPADDNVSYYIQQQRLLTFACHPVSSAADSMLVAVQTGTIVDLSTDTFTLFFGSQEDLTSYIPAGAGEWCLACLFWKGDNTIEIFASTPKDNPDDLGIDDINECMAARTSGSLPIWAWRLYNGQTGIASGAPANGGDDFMDLRPLFFMLQGGGSGTPLSVTDGTTTVDPTTTLDFDPAYFDVTDGGGGTAEVTFVGDVGTVDSVVAGANIDVDATDPENPIVSLEDTITLPEVSTPSAPASDSTTLYAADDNGFTVTRWIESGGVVFQNGRDSWLVAKNIWGGTIAKGKAVSLSVNGGDVSCIGASNVSVYNVLAQGIAMDSIVDGDYGRILLRGVLTDFDTSALSANSIIYLTTAGGLTNTIPTAGAGWVQRLGFVLTSHATTGSVYFYPYAPDPEKIYRPSIYIGNGSFSSQVFLVAAGGTGQIYVAALTADRDWTMPDASGTVALVPPFAVIEEQQATNTAGGTSVATTWTTRILNTTVVDADGIVSISSNQFTPIAGVYSIFATSPFIGNASLSSGRLRLQNITQGTTNRTSNNFTLSGNGAGIMTLQTQFTANGTDAYAIQYYLTLGRVTNGLGGAVNEASAVERFTQVLLQKVG